MFTTHKDTTQIIIIIYKSSFHLNSEHLRLPWGEGGYYLTRVNVPHGVHEGPVIIKCSFSLSC